ncbi:MAG: hypothetical protein AB7P99_15300 [Vicinamibacterales bacterium]
MSDQRDIDTILNEHAEMFRAIRQASDSFDAAVAGLQQTLRSLSVVNHAQEAAISAALSANHAALRLNRARNGE